MLTPISIFNNTNPILLGPVCLHGKEFLGILRNIFIKVLKMEEIEMTIDKMAIK